MTKILIYGFKPFKNYRKNISEEVVKKLKIKNELKIKKVILPITFEKKFILKEIQKYRPDIILGLGQRKGGKLLEIERKAKNIYRKKGSKIKKQINPWGPKEYLLNLKLKKKSKGAKIDYHSSDYLCNFTRYVIMDFIKKKGLKTKFAFIHIPRNYKIQKALKIIKKLISQIEK